MSVVDFYDALADDYDIVYGGRWEDAVGRQGRVLDALLQGALGPGAKEVLDCLAESERRHSAWRCKDIESMAQISASVPLSALAVKRQRSVLLRRSG